MLDSGATLSFVTPLVTGYFNVLPDVLMELFLGTNPVGDSVMARIVFTSCAISLPSRITLVELV